MSALFRRFVPVADWLLAPFVWAAASFLKEVRRIGIRRLPKSRATLMRVGIYPLRNHDPDACARVAPCARPELEPCSIYLQRAC
jgi:hypothetical protein